MNCLFLLYISTVKLSGNSFIKCTMPKLLIVISVFAYSAIISSSFTLCFLIQSYSLRDLSVNISSDKEALRVFPLHDFD